MGANESGQRKDSRLSQCVYVRKINEGCSLLRSTKTGMEFVRVDHVFATQELLNLWLQQTKLLSSVNHQHFVNVVEQEIVIASNICSKQYKVSRYFRYEQWDLLQQIEKRATLGKHFRPQQIWAILCSCVLTMAYFSKHDITHFQLSPSSIIIDQSGVIKLLHSQLTVDGYQPPEALRSCAVQLNNRSGMFVLGITMLHAISLKSMEDLYGEDGINMEILAARVQAVDDFDLRMILQKMLKYHAYDRITFTQLEQMLFETITRSNCQSSRNISEAYQISRLEESIVKMQLKTVEPKEDSLTSPHDQQDNTQEEVLMLLQSDPFKIDEEESDEARRDKCLEINTIIHKSLMPELAYKTGQEFSQDCQFESCMQSDRSLQSSSIANTRREVAYRPLNADKENILCDKRESNVRDALTEVSKGEFPIYVNENIPSGRYQGYKMHKFRNGFGTFYYKDGGKYSGEWVNNKMQGRGALYYASGKLAYEGEWLADRLHGYGVLYNEQIVVIEQGIDLRDLSGVGSEWIKYEGYFAGDKKQGEGTLFFSNGEYYRGRFSEDIPNGEGFYRNLKGEMIHGRWQAGRLI